MSASMRAMSPQAWGPPEVLVEVSSSIQGKITKIHPTGDWNAVVKKGEPLAELDSASFEADFRIARAQVDSAEAELLLAKQNLAKAAAARTEAEGLREELAHQTKSLAEREAAMQQAEVMMQKQMDQAMVQQAEIEQEQSNLKASKVAIEQETAALAERVWMFESKQQQIREQMKQLLAAS